LRFGFCTHFLPFQFHWLFHFPAFHLLRLKGKPTEKQNQDGISLVSITKCTVISFFSH
jgi:hypothetical protein